MTAIGVAAVIEVYRIWYYHGTTHYDEPPIIPVGDRGGIQYNFRNISGRTLSSVECSITLRSPTGLTVGTSGGPYEMEPDKTRALSLKWTVDEIGVWTATCWIKVEGEIVWAMDEEPIAYVTGEGIPEGDIDTWRLWDWESESWVRPSPTLVPKGEDIGIMGKGYNSSDSTLEMRMDTKMYPPGGGSSLITGDIKVVPPNLLPDEYPEWERIWQPTEAGDWYADLILYARTYGGATMVEIDRRESIAVAHVVEAAPPGYEGTITEKLLRYDSNEAPIPVSDIPAGVYEGLVIIRGRNDTSVNQKMGVHWIVKDPDGVVVDSYTRWENFWTGPGLEQAFINQGGAFALNKEGDYTLEVQLLMNPDDPVTVDSYDGVLCRVSAEEFKGTITTKLLDYDESRKAIPVSDVPTFASGSLLIWGRNDTNTTRQMGISWKVRDPDGVVVDSYEAWEMWPYCPPGDEHGFVGNRFPIDKEGIYTVEIDLLMNYSDPVVVDSYIGTLCSTTGEIPPEYELIYENIYPFAYIYSGEVEVTTATFRTDPFTPAGWLGNMFASKLEEEVRTRGGRTLEVKVYVDVSPLLWKDFRIEVIATPLEGVGTATVAALPLWAMVLIAALAASAVMVTATILINTIIKAFKSYPALEDVKPGWSKETLILTIQDSEEYWERTSTPIATLEGMSEGELRYLLDEIAEEEVPTAGIPWWVWPVGAGVVGVAVIAIIGARR